MYRRAIRSLLWSLSAGATVGLAARFAFISFSSEVLCYFASQAAWSLVFWASLSALPVAISMAFRRDHAGTAVVSLLSAIAVGTVAGTLFSAFGGPGDGPVGFVAGPMVGALLGAPLAAAAWHVRRLLSCPTTAIGAGRSLLVTLSLILFCGGWLGSADGDIAYPMWPIPMALLAGFSLLCLGSARRDARLASLLRRLQRAEDPRWEVVGSTAGAEGIHPVVVRGKFRTSPVLALMRKPAGEGAYRAGGVQVPVLSLPASVEETVRALWRRMAVLVCLAVALGVCAARFADLAPLAPSRGGATLASVRLCLTQEEISGID